MNRQVFTIGHSSREFAQMLALLRQHGITALGDVRSQPYSRRYPQFSREPLEKRLKEAGVHYVFLGRELGARSDDPSCYENGIVRYERLAKTELFQSGLDRVERGMASQRLALLCAEKEPLNCHRFALVSRELARRGVSVLHILDDGCAEPHEETVSRMLRSLRLEEPDLFRTYDEIVASAYRLHGEKIAYVRDESEERDTANVRGEARPEDHEA